MVRRSNIIIKNIVLNKKTIKVNFGIDINSLAINKFVSFDEFYIGGLEVTLNLINQLSLKSYMSVG